MVTPFSCPMRAIATMIHGMRITLKASTGLAHYTIIYPIAHTEYSSATGRIISTITTATSAIPSAPSARSSSETEAFLVFHACVGVGFRYLFLYLQNDLKSDRYEDHTTDILRADAVCGISGLGADAGAELEVGKTH